jgi:hypothetical protein
MQFAEELVDIKDMLKNLKTNHIVKTTILEWKSGVVPINIDFRFQMIMTRISQIYTHVY